MILMLDEKNSNLKQNVFCFIVVYYLPDEINSIKRLPKMEVLNYGKYKFTTTYIDFQRIIKDFKKKGFRISIDADDIPKIFGVYSIKRKAEHEKRDRETFLDGK